MAENLEEQILKILMARHVGKAQAIGADGLYLELFNEPPAHKINDTYRVREAIRNLRRRCELICSDKTGYWWPATPEELEASAQRLEDRGKASLAQAAAMRRGAASLKGQMHLEPEP